MEVERSKVQLLADFLQHDRVGFRVRIEVGRERFRIRREDEIARSRASVPQIERVRAWMALPPAERYATRDTLTKEDLRLAQKLYLAEPARNAAVNDLMR